MKPISKFRNVVLIYGVLGVAIILLVSSGLFRKYDHFKEIESPPRVTAFIGDSIGKVEAEALANSNAFAALSVWRSYDYSNNSEKRNEWAYHFTKMFEGEKDAGKIKLIHESLKMWNDDYEVIKKQSEMYKTVALEHTKPR